MTAFSRSVFVGRHLDSNKPTHCDANLQVLEYALVLLSNQEYSFVILWLTNWSARGNLIPRSRRSYGRVEDPACFQRGSEQIGSAWINQRALLSPLPRGKSKARSFGLDSLLLLIYKAFSFQPYDLLISSNAPCFGHECHLPCGVCRGRAA